MTREARNTASSATTMYAPLSPRLPCPAILITELELGTSSVFEDHTALFIIPNIHKIDSNAH